MIASAARVTTRRTKMPRGNGVSQPWQDEGWHFLDTVGELAFANQWIANALSRVTLQVEEVKADGETEPSTNPAALAALDALFYGETGQAQMLHTFGIHLTTPGETYLVGVPSGDGTDADDDLWRVLSNKELRQQGSQWIIDRGDGVEEKYEDGSNPAKPAEALVIRIWRPHPAKWVEATSPVRAALPILRELEGLTKHVAATIDSRLAGAGILLLPKEATFETPVESNQDATDSTLDPFMQQLIEAMLTPIRDRGSAAAVVPPVIRMPGELIEKVQHIKFWSEFSEKVLELIDAKIHRLALSMDMPPEELTGKGDMNHWGGWLASEDGIKLHIEPLVGLITDALTTKYLWPALLPVGADPDAPPPPEVRRFIITGDTSNLRQRPERSSEAMTLHERMVLTDKALGRETGFEDGDLLTPGSEEWKRRVLTQIAAGPLPDLALAAIQALGLNITPTPAAVPEGPSTGDVRAIGSAPSAQAPTPAIEQPRNPPEPGGTQVASGVPDGPSAVSVVARALDAVEPAVARRAAVLTAADLLVTRALERASSRLFGRGRNARRRPITDPQKVANALVDAWPQVPAAATSLGVDPAALTTACDTYARELLARGMEHNHDLLAAVVDRLVLGLETADRG